MLTNSDVSYIGFISRTHGYKGGFKIKPLGVRFPEINPKWFFFLVDGKPVPYPIKELQRQEDEWVAMVDFIGSDEEVQALMNVHVGVKAELVREDQTTPFLNLEGYTLFTQDLEYIGELKNLIDRPGQPLMEVSRGEELVLIPLVEEWIVELDEDQKRLVLNLPEGILDL